MAHDQQPAGASRCSFCGKPQEQVRKLIAGPSIHICDACVKVCNEILDDAGIDREPSPPAELRVGAVVCPACRHNFALHTHVPRGEA